MEITHDMVARICQIRKDTGLSQKAFGEVLGIAQSTVSSMEHGERITMQSIKTICSVFQVSEEYLLYGKGTPADKEIIELIALYERMGPIEKRMLLLFAHKVPDMNPLRLGEDPIEE